MFQYFKQTIQSKFTNKNEDIVKVHRRIYWMPFPKQEIIQSLSQQLDKLFGNNYYIWNISEHQYETQYFNNQVALHQYTGLPCPPLYEAFLISKCILNWLEKDDVNIAVVHCQKNKGRSVLILSLLLALLSKEQVTSFYKIFFRTKPDEFFIQVNKLLKINHYEIQPCQRLYLSYICNVFSFIPLNNASIRLVSIIFNGIPTIMGKKSDGSPETHFRPQLLVVKKGIEIFDSLKNNELSSYSKEDQSIIFNLHGIEIFQDTLIKCKHRESDKVIYTVIRVMLHTAFIFNNIIRLYPRDFDRNAIEFDETFFIDIIFERGIEKISQNAKDDPNYNDVKLTEAEHSEEDQSQIEGNSLILKLYQQSREIGERIYQNELQRLKVDWIPKNILQQGKKNQEKQTQQDEKKEMEQVKPREEQKEVSQQQEQKKFTVQVLDDDDYYDFKVSK